MAVLVSMNPDGPRSRRSAKQATWFSSAARCNAVIYRSQQKKGVKAREEQKKEENVKIKGDKKGERTTIGGMSLAERKKILL